jgi:hypothetical protein
MPAFADQMLRMPIRTLSRCFRKFVQRNPLRSPNSATGSAHKSQQRNIDNRLD